MVGGAVSGPVWAALITSLGLLLAGVIGSLFLVNHKRAEAFKFITESAEKVVGISDRTVDRIEHEFDAYRLRAQGLWRATERLVDVHEPLMRRFRPPPDEDTATATVTIQEYLASRDSIHDAREHLR